MVANSLERTERCEAHQPTRERTMPNSDIVNNAIAINSRMIDKSRCADGWIGIVRYDRFERLLNRKIGSGNDISLYSPAPNANSAALAPHRQQHSNEQKLIQQRQIICIGYSPNTSLGNTLGKSLTPIAKRTLALASLLSSSLNLSASSSMFRRSIL